MFLGATSIFRSHLDSPVCSNARQEQKRKVLERDGFDVPVKETIHVLHGTSCCRIGGIRRKKPDAASEPVLELNVFFDTTSIVIY